MERLILADDLTGAADCALAFAEAGHHADVLLDVPSSPGEGVVAIDLDTRQRNAEKAAERTIAAFRTLGSGGTSLYCKIDSTLRGPWAASVAALHRVAGVALVAPAFPAQGRTVKGGHVYVEGKRLDETPIWRPTRGAGPSGIVEALEQAGLRCARIDAQALAGDPGRVAAMMAQAATQGAQALACDAATDDALAALAAADREMSFPRFWVGSAGMAGAIARASASHRATKPVPQLVRGCIVTVAGSLSDVTDRQCEALAREGRIRSIVVDPDQPSLAEAFSSGEDLLIRIGRGRRGVEAVDPALATTLGKLLQPHAHHVGAWILTGGDTARGILKACGIERLQVIEAIEPGIALTVGIGARVGAALVVTKAGAFGSAASLEHAYRHLASGRGA